MQRALIVGVTGYDTQEDISHGVLAVKQIGTLLETNADGSKNFETTCLWETDKKNQVTSRQLKIALMELFSEDSEMALFYYSGYGFFDQNHGYLLTTDYLRSNEGLAMEDILMLANKSKAKNKVLLLDLFNQATQSHSYPKIDRMTLNEGVTMFISYTKPPVLPASSSKFTQLLSAALQGAASNQSGQVSASSIYAYMDQTLSDIEQRPIFMTNAKNFVRLRDTLDDEEPDKPALSKNKYELDAEKQDFYSNLKHFQHMGLPDDTEKITTDKNIEKLKQ